MLRFFRSSHGHVDRILPRRLPAVLYIHGAAKFQEPEIANPSFGGLHPWSEWMELMNLLSQKGYFGDDANPSKNSELSSKASNLIRTACLNFARDRSALVRYLSRKAIKVIAGCGCPSIDRKVVNSGKRLRAHLGIAEGDVCGSCELRGECERAYVEAREEEGARTVDVMRVLLVHAQGLALNEGNRMNQTDLVEDSVRKLLREIVEYSSKDPEPAKTSRNEELRQCSPDTDERDALKKAGDWECPQCKFLNFARHLRCLRCDVLSEERLQRWKKEQIDHLPLKKGDWICVKCNFMNFARRTRCLRCEEKPTNRKLNPGDWECQSCNYINFGKNSTCLKCDHRRPKASISMNVSAQAQHKSDTTLSDHQSRDPKAWSFVEDGLGKHRSRALRRGEYEEEFMEFPVEGGNGVVSKSVKKREKWKSEMLQRRRRKEEDDEVETELSYNEQRKLELLGNVSDDEEMEEWFAPTKR